MAGVATATIVTEQRVLTRIVSVELTAVRKRAEIGRKRFAARITTAGIATVSCVSATAGITTATAAAPRVGGEQIVERAANVVASAVTRITGVAGITMITHKRPLS